MAKVRIKTNEGTEFVEKNGILKSKVIQSIKEGKNKGKFYISCDYGDNKQLLIGSFDDETTAENIIINDL